VDAQPLMVESRAQRSLTRICEEPFRIFLSRGRLDRNTGLLIACSF
jgi:hypothetical protein